MLLNILKFFTIASLCLVYACDSVNTQIKEDKVLTNEPPVNTSNKEELVFTEPIEFTGIKSNDKIPENIRQIWRDFVSDGKYRLAQPSDMTFTEAAKSLLPGQGKSPIVPYEYVWGDLNFQKRIEDEHLAAIVVDITKNGSEKFGLVIFSPVKNTNDKYDINWLYRDKDLSKTTVHRASGDLFVAEYLDDGSRNVCSVNWNQKLKKFECN